ncbi:expressed protein [Phakopsora pachyrhizi]|uniref:Expressed protein n=1 Tax=Phakopsora pachyrhizi TaxID=170000 RepID=A0AAV0B723_PHAPC|nr:expressed protein [Phakopsora pachyrhizi]
MYSYLKFSPLVLLCLNLSISTDMIDGLNLLGTSEESLNDHNLPRRYRFSRVKREEEVPDSETSTDTSQVEVKPNKPITNLTPEKGGDQGKNFNFDPKKLLKQQKKVTKLIEKLSKESKKLQSITKTNNLETGINQSVGSGKGGDKKLDEKVGSIKTGTESSTNKLDP